MGGLKVGWLGWWMSGHVYLYKNVHDKIEPCTRSRFQMLSIGRFLSPDAGS
jgi:hypothetical protein